MAQVQWFGSNNNKNMSNNNDKNKAHWNMEQENIKLNNI